MTDSNSAKFTFSQLRDAIHAALVNQRLSHLKELEELRSQLESSEARRKELLQRLTPAKAFDDLRSATKRHSFDAWELDELIKKSARMLLSESHQALSLIDNPTTEALLSWINALACEISTIEETDFRVLDCLKEASRIIEFKEDDVGRKSILMHEFTQVYAALTSLRTEPLVFEIVHSIIRLEDGAETALKYFDSTLASWSKVIAKVIATGVKPLANIETPSRLDPRVIYVGVAAARGHEDIRRRLLKVLDIFEAFEPQPSLSQYFTAKQRVAEHLLKLLGENHKHIPHGVLRVAANLASTTDLARELLPKLFGNMQNEAITSASTSRFVSALDTSHSDVELEAPHDVPGAQAKEMQDDTQCASSPDSLLKLPDSCAYCTRMKRRTTNALLLKRRSIDVCTGWEIAERLDDEIASKV